jgi:hypothetical protein
MDNAGVRQWSAWSAVLVLGAGLVRWTRRAERRVGSGPSTGGTLPVAGPATRQKRYVFHPDVFAAEQKRIENRRRALRPDWSPPSCPQHTIGLALSGGGIRSATFSLGVLQSLARRRLLPRIDGLFKMLAAHAFPASVPLWTSRAAALKWWFVAAGLVVPVLALAGMLLRFRWKARAQRTEGLAGAGSPP